MKSIRSLRLVLGLVLSLSGTAWAQRAVSISVTGNQLSGAGTASVLLVSQGDENAIGFSVTFNPAVLRFDSHTLGAGATGATLNLNDSQKAAGKVGFAIALPTNSVFSAGSKELVVLSFTVLAPSASETIDFGSQPILKEVSDVTANELTAVTYTPLTIVTSLPPAAPAITTQPQPQTVSAGTLAMFSVVATGSPAPTYVWKKGATILTDGQTASGSVIMNSGTAMLHIGNVTVADAGSYTVTVANGVTPDAVSAAATLTVNKADQTITFGALAAKVFGDAAFTLGATASSNLAVTYASSNTGVATVSGSTVTIVGGGAATITASQAGDVNYDAAVNATQTLTVAKAAATVALDAATLAQGYNGAARVVTATTTPASIPVVITYDGASTAPTNVGSYAVVATIDSNNYSGTASGTLVISKGNQTINFAALSQQIYVPNGTLTLSATSTSSLPVTFASSDPAVATVSGNTVTFVGVGSTNITASQTGSTNFNAAPDVVRQLDIVKNIQTITFAALAEKTFAPNATFDISAAAAPSGLSVSFASSNPAVAMVGPTTLASGTSTATVIIMGAGSADITASQPGDPNFGPAVNVVRTLTVNKATAQVDLVGLAATFDGTPKVVTATTTPASLTVNLTYALGAGTPSPTPPTNAGSYSVVATIADANFQGSATDALVIAKAPQTINFGAIAGKTYGDFEFTVTATASSSLPVTFASTTATVATVTSTGNVTLVAGGTASLSASQAGNENYLAAPDVSQTFAVAKAAATVAIDPGTLAQTYDGTSRAVTATPTPAGLPLVVTYDASALVPVNAGPYAVLATINDPRYQGTASGTLVVAKASQTIAFVNFPSGKALDDATFTAVATASSGLPVTFASSTPGVATINPTTGAVSYVGVGVTTITASIGESTNYLAAIDASTTLTLTPNLQTIDFAVLPARSYLANDTFTVSATAKGKSGNATGLAVDFVSSNPTIATVGTTTLSSGVSSATVSVLAAGTIDVIASQLGSPNFAPADPVVRPLVINPAAATVVLGNLTATYDGTPKPVTATPANLNIVFAYGAAPGSPTPPINAGTYPVTATVQEANYTGNATGNLVIAKANQTITFPVVGSPKLINAGSFGLSATATSNLTVTFTSSNSNVATVSGNTVTIVGLGTTTLSAKQAGDTNFNPAVDATQTLTVNPVAPVIVSAPAVVPTAIKGSPFLYGPITLNALSAPATFSATGLPAGLVVNTANGNISGIPTAEGTASVTLTVTNATSSDSKAFTIVVQPPAPIITSDAAASAVAGTPFAYTVTALPATGVTFAASGVPAWLTFTPGTAVLAGTPTTAGSVTVSLTASNATGSATLPLIINTTLPANAPAYVGPLNPSGTAGTAFSFTPNFGTGTTTYAITGTLPTGLIFSASTGAITGTTQQPGTFPVVVSATRSGLTATANLNLTINPAATAPVVSVTGGNVRSATVGAIFGPINITATPAATSFNFSTSAAWVTIGGTGTAPTITGTPTMPGTATVAITATNSAGAGPAATLVITVNPHPQAPVVTSAPAVQGREGDAFTYTLAATPAGTTTYGMTGTLPAGLTFDGNAGTVMGTPAVGSMGSYPVYFAGTNSNGIGFALLVTINIAQPLTVPVINSNGTAAAQVGQAFNYQITATNSPTSYGATPLPAGLTLDAGTGVISGVPTTATGATPASVALTAGNANGNGSPKTLAITIASAPATPVVMSASTANGRVGVVFAYQITASATPTSYAATGLPPGLSVNPATGAISGTPTESGTVVASLRAANAAGLGAAAPFTIAVASALTAPSISSAASVVGQVGVSFTYQIVAAPAPITSYAYTGTLPDGLSFNSATGTISGSPTQPGPSIITVTATGAGGTSNPQPLLLLINPAANVPLVTSAGIATGNVGVNFSYQILATNDPHTSLDAVNLPAGLAVNPGTGVIQGSPLAVGTTVASLVGTNTAGTGPSRDLTIVVAPAVAAPEVTGASQVSAQVGAAFIYQIIATGNPTSYEVFGAPAWMTLNTTTGAIAGTPTTPGLLPVFLLARNTAGASAPKLFTLAIAPSANTPLITSSRGTSGTVGTGFAAYTITAAPAATSFVAVGLPPGLSLNGSTGVITGTPTASGVYPVGIYGSNASGQGAATVVVFTIEASVTFGQ